MDLGREGGKVADSICTYTGFSVIASSNSATAHARTRGYKRECRNSDRKIRGSGRHTAARSGISRLSRANSTPILARRPPSDVPYHSSSSLCTFQSRITTIRSADTLHDYRFAIPAFRSNDSFDHLKYGPSGIISRNESLMRTPSQSFLQLIGSSTILKLYTTSAESYMYVLSQSQKQLTCTIPSHRNSQISEDLDPRFPLAQGGRDPHPILPRGLFAPSRAGFV